MLWVCRFLFIVRSSIAVPMYDIEEVDFISNMSDNAINKIIIFIGVAVVSFAGCTVLG